MNLKPRNPASHARTAGALRTRRHKVAKAILPRKQKHKKGHDHV